MTLSAINKHKAKIIPLIIVMLFTVSWMAQPGQSSLETIDTVANMAVTNIMDELPSSSDNGDQSIITQDTSIDAFNTKTAEEEFPEFIDEQDTDVKLVLNSSQYYVGQTFAVNITSTANSWQTLNGSMEWTLRGPDGETVFNSSIKMNKALNMTIDDVNATLADDNATVHEFYNSGFVNQSTWSSQVLESTTQYNSTTVQEVIYYSSNGTKIITNTTFPGYINITIELPVYPALLGTWQFQLFLNNTDDATRRGKIPRYYDAKFLVTEEINYKLENTFVERGVYDDNGTIKPYFANETGFQEFYSPGDNITFIGKFFYNSTPDMPINTSLLSLTAKSKFVHDDKEWTNIGYLRYYNNKTASIPQGNLTSPYDSTNYTAFNFNIPLENIYGNVNVTITLTFEYGDFGPKHQVEIVFDPVEVRYRLYVESESIPAGNTVYITQRVSGNATVLTAKWNQTLETDYSEYNYSVDFLIPASDLNVEIYQYLNTESGNELHLFEVTRINYTFYWDIPTGIDSEQITGDYTLKLRWLTPKTLNESTSVAWFDSKLEYSYSFTIDPGTLVVVDLNSGFRFVKDVAKNILFQIKVNETGKILSHDAGLTVEIGGTAVNHVFIKTLYQYKVTFTPTEVGELTVVIKQDDTVIGSMTLTVEADVPFTSTPPDPSVFEAEISFTDILIFAAIVVVLLGFAVIILKFLPR